MTSGSSRSNVTVTQRGWAGNRNSRKNCRRAEEEESGCMKSMCKPDDTRKVKKVVTADWGTVTKQTEQTPKSWKLSLGMSVWIVPGIVSSPDLESWVHSSPWKRLPADGLLNSSQSWVIAGMDLSPLTTVSLLMATLFQGLREFTSKDLDYSMDHWPLFQSVVWGTSNSLEWP